jgi:predicted transcriptional regulator
MLEVMVTNTRTIHLDEDTDTQLAQLARQKGKSVEALLEEAARELANYRRAFLAELELGIKDAEAGRFVTADEVRATVKARLDGLKR